MHTMSNSARNKNVQTLYEDYLKNRSIKLSYEEFLYILTMFPSLLVCMSDGKLDKEEWVGINSIASGLAEEFAATDLNNRDKEQLRAMLNSEFRYLLDNLDRWEKKYLSALKSYLDENNSEREFILESMYLFANAADGISGVEQEAINKLSKRLELTF